MFHIYHRRLRSSHAASGTTDMFFAKKRRENRVQALQRVRKGQPCALILLEDLDNTLTETLEDLYLPAE